MAGEEVRYSLAQYLLLLAISPTIGLGVWAGISLFLGFGARGTLISLFVALPLVQFSVLYGFYKGMVRHYGFNGEDKLFFDGRL